MPAGRNRFALFAGSAILALLAVGARPAFAQQVTLGNARSLDFGRFVAGSGGTIVLSAAGLRSATGGVILLGSQGAGEALFNLGTDAGADGGGSVAVTILLPPNGTVRLSSGANSMAVDNFTSTPAALDTIPAGGATLAVGATLVVAPNQAPGNYSGSFSLIVNYQ